MSLAVERIRVGGPQQRQSEIVEELDDHFRMSADPEAFRLKFAKMASSP